MGSLLSAISGQFAKMIILGTLFPVVIASALNILLVAPLLPQTASLPAHLARVAVGDEKWPAVVLSFVAFVLTGLLYDLNTPIIRLYEGYPWQKSMIGTGLCRLQKRRLQKALSLTGSTVELEGQMNLPGDKTLFADLQGQETALELFLNSEFPDDESLLLPTRLGNVIRCFERYPYQAYGMDAIVLWPRLLSKIDSAFASTIDEAKTSFDFMLNLSFLSGLTTLAILMIGLIAPAPLEWAIVWPWFWRAALFALLTVIFYSFSVNRAMAWGQQVRSAFDLYRLDLLNRLGYQQKPLTYQEERAIWLTISSQLAYAEDRVAPLAYDQPSTRTIPYPTDIILEVERTYGMQEANLRIPVQIKLKNPDPVRQVSSVAVIDSLPDGYKYVADSAAVSVDDIGLAVRRIAPPEFFLGPLGAGETVTVSYVMKPAT
jgi:hypothetical protein